MSIAAGRLRHRVTIQALTPVYDSDGDVIQDQNTGEVLRVWTTLGEVWAAVEPISGREFIQSAETQSQITTRITIRRQDFTVTAAMRALHGVKVYNIHGVLADKDSGLEYQTLPCSEGVSDSGQ
jgi:SPP1 family predicted phage head-tail adaptor